MHTVTLIVDAADFGAIRDAVDLRLTFAAGLPDGGGNQSGRAVASICRGWVEMFDAVPDAIDSMTQEGADVLAENERLKARNAALREALRDLLRDTAEGVFAAGGSEERAARAALLAGEVS